jgi:hypothetical protein
MTATAQITLNRRQESRIFNTFPVFVRTISSTGQPIKANTLTDNISPGGLFIQLPCQIADETQLFTFIRLPNSAGLAAIGRIVRSENKGQGLSGFAVCFSQTRLLPLSVAK